MKLKEAKKALINSLNQTNDLDEAKLVVERNRRVIKQKTFDELIRLIERGIYINRLYGGYDSDYRVPHFIEIIYNEINDDRNDKKRHIA